MKNKKAYFKECPNCGASLDPGELCDCKKGPHLLQKVTDTTKNFQLQYSTIFRIGQGVN